MEEEEEEHIYEEIIYSETTPPPSVFTVTTTTAPSTSHAVRVNSTSSSTRRLTASISLMNINGNPKSPTSKKKKAFSFSKLNRVIKCNCCLQFMNSGDMAPTILPKFLKCHHCKEYTCKKCLDDLFRCHECIVRLTTILEPKDMMRMRTKTLLHLTLSLHYPEEAFRTVHKAYLVKQLLTRFHKYPEFDPKTYVEKHLMKSTENLIDFDFSESKSSPQQILSTKHLSNNIEHHSHRHHQLQEESKPNMARQSSYFHSNVDDGSQLQRTKSNSNVVGSKAPKPLIPKKPTQSYRPAATNSNFQRSRSIGNCLNDKIEEDIKTATDIKKPELKSLDEKIAIFETKYANGDRLPSFPFNVFRQKPVEPKANSRIGVSSSVLV